MSTVFAQAIGAMLRFIDLRFEEGFALDPEAVKNALTVRTKYISVTYPHNPTGACLSHEDMQTLAAIAGDRGIYLLVDETYRDMRFGQPLPLAAEYGDHVISISSLSKTYGLPGLRGDLGTRGGAIAGYEQPLSSKVTFLTDWFSGKNAFGYVTPGFSFATSKKTLLNAGYSVGNHGRKNNALFVYFGITL